MTMSTVLSSELKFQIGTKDTMTIHGDKHHKERSRRFVHQRERERERSRPGVGDWSPPAEALWASRTAQSFSASGTLQSVYGSCFINKVGDQFRGFSGVWYELLT